VHGSTRAGRVGEFLFRARGGPRAALGALAIRLVGGTIFLLFGVYKFTDHAKETASFESYGLPSPSLFAYAIGVVEIAGGLLLLLGLLTRPAALVLAGDMVGAVATAGPTEGGGINLGLAPLLLVWMLVLAWIGPGRWALDERLARSPLWSATS
jgi:putative oxidoreductase